MKRFSWLFGWVIAAAFCSPAAAAPTLWSSGDLDGAFPPNVITAAGDFALNPSLTTPSNSLLATLSVKYGLWSVPSQEDYGEDATIDIEIFVNSVKVTTLVLTNAASDSYGAVPPLVAIIDVTGRLKDGVNSIFFTGNSLNNGEYVIGQVDLAYDDSGNVDAVPTPEPGTLALMTFGAMGLAAGKYRKKKKAA